MIKCGHCKHYHETTYAVRFCAQVEYAERNAKRDREVLDTLDSELDDYAERQAAYTFGRY